MLREFAAPLWERKATLQQNAPQLIDQRGSFTHQPVTGSVERLKIAC
jgi:hypothetical protein